MRADATKAILSEGATIKTSVVLLVEDELFVREVTREVLKHGGFSVIESASPEEAIQAASHYKGHIDVLLTDVVMPGMNGVELAHRLQEAQPDLVTVFMSGYAESDVVKKMTQKQVIHIQKPFTVDMLLSSLTRALHASLQNNALEKSLSLSV